MGFNFLKNNPDPCELPFTLRMKSDCEIKPLYKRRCEIRAPGFGCSGSSCASLVFPQNPNPAPCWGEQHWEGNEDPIHGRSKLCPWQGHQDSSEHTLGGPCCLCNVQYPVIHLMEDGGTNTNGQFGITASEGFKGCLQKILQVELVCGFQLMRLHQGSFS